MSPHFFCTFQNNGSLFFAIKTPISFRSLSNKLVFPKETNIYFLSVHRFCLQKSMEFCIILLPATY